nr:BAF_HP1_G0009120.mRNA.1.CDS.1 [Saccharomyces cerevisiae]
MGLGLEKAAPDLMDRPPNDSEVGIFTWEVIIDTFAYGIIMTGSCMASFTGSLYGINSGRLGHDCDGTYNSSCRDVYRSRSAAFATMTWCALILAWEVVDMRRSFFRMHPDTDSPVKEFFRSIWGNQFLFWSIIFGFVSAFPVVYIPVINDKVFLHKPIGAEWGLAIAFTIAFWVGAELYKCGKRRYFKTQRAHNPENDLESNNKRDPFEAYSTSTTIHTEVNIGIKQ